MSRDLISIKQCYYFRKSVIHRKTAARDSHANQRKGGGLWVRVQEEDQLACCLHGEEPVARTGVPQEGSWDTPRGVTHPSRTLPCRTERGSGPTRFRARAVCTTGRGGRGVASHHGPGFTHTPVTRKISSMLFQLKIIRNSIHRTHATITLAHATLSLHMQPSH